MAMRVALIDYGSGNLHSAFKAFERAARDGAIASDIVIVNKSDEILAADKIVLPGVGAFADCRHGLAAVDGLLEALNEAVIVRGKPFFGICVGMQLMATIGYEKRSTTGLDWIAGSVKKMQPVGLKIPHIGWNTLTVTQSSPLFSGIDSGEAGLHAYFVHSYALQAADAKDCLAYTEYGGKITAAVIRNNMFGTQFHPEKSQKLGLKLIANFLRWKP